jgi:CRP-like cAMP-binding protein
VDALYVLLEGGLERIRAHPESPPDRSHLIPGDSFGELEITYGVPWSASARALQDCTLLAWDRGDLLEFLRRHPGARRRLQFTAQSRKMAQDLDLHWLAVDESIYALTRRHSIVFLRRLLIPMALYLLGAWAGTQAFTVGGSLYGAVATGSIIVGGLLTVWNWIDWRNDFFAITNRRVVRQEKILALYEGHEEALMHMILSVSASTSVLGRLLGFGDIEIRTYTGEVRFRDVPLPEILGDIMQGNWRRAKIQARQQEEDVTSQIVRDIIEGAPDADPAVPPEARIEGHPTGADRPDPPTSRWGFLLRTEEDGVITYRKHWAVLLRRLTPPSAALLALIAWAGLSLSGQVRLELGLSTYLVSAALLVLILLWWLYEYLDWANDIYQVSPRQIIDIHRKPLASEVRKVAPIENILGTKVERGGISGLLLNYGSVITNIGTEQFVFDGVYDPSGVQRDIVSALESRLARMEEDERRQRRDEMIEWLRAYHREASDSDQTQAVTDRD